MLRQQMYVRRPPDVDRASTERQRLAAARRRLEAEAQNLENEISDLTTALGESRDADNNVTNDRMPGRPDVNQELHRMREELGIAEVDDLFFPGEGGGSLCRGHKPYVPWRAAGARFEPATVPPASTLRAGG